MMQARVWRRGREWTVYLLADGEREFAREFVDGELTDDQRKKVVAMIARVVDHGLPHNEQKYRQFEDIDNLAEFKPGDVRLLCFFDGPRRIVVTHGFKKRSQKTPRGEIRRAIALRNSYLAEKKAHHGR